jgi:hypothetical protein
VFIIISFFTKEEKYRWQKKRNEEIIIQKNNDGGLVILVEVTIDEHSSLPSSYNNPSFNHCLPPTTTPGD